MGGRLGRVAGRRGRELGRESRLRAYRSVQRGKVREPSRDHASALGTFCPEPSRAPLPLALALLALRAVVIGNVGDLGDLYVVHCEL